MSYVLIVFYFYRKNPLSFLGVAIGKFVEVNVKSSIDNYFNKGTVLKEEDSVCNQSNIPESIATCSTTSDTAESDGGLSCDKKLQTNPKISTLISNQISSSNHINNKKTDNCTNNIKSIKTMFAEMKSSNESYDSSTVQVQNVNIKKKTTINSFFSNKLKIISPVKNQVDDKITTTTDSSSRASPVSFFSKKLEIISPSKNVLNDNVQSKTRAQDSFFSRKLEIISPSKTETTNDLTPVTIIQPPLIEETDENVPSKLLCERCEKMIDIDLYDEHYDHHVAVELSKSWNSDGIAKPLVKSGLHNESPKKKKNECTRKRKNNSNTSSSNSKKQCSSISSYFKPVLNP